MEIKKILIQVHLLKKTDYSSKITKISEIESKVNDHNHDKYITTPEFNTLAARIFNARLAQANLVTKADFDAKLQSLNKNINPNKTKHLLVEYEIKKKLNNFDAAYFGGKNYLGDNGIQNYLVFQLVNRCFKKIGKTKTSSWKSKGLFAEVLKPPTINNNSLAPKLEYIDEKKFVKFNGSSLIKHDGLTSNKKIVNVYIVYDLDSNLNNFEPTLKNCLFGAVELTKNSDIDKYQYRGYGIGFDS